MTNPVWVLRYVRQADNSSGGPAACAAPAGSRSDKKRHHTDSTGRKPSVSQTAQMCRSRYYWSRMEQLLVAARPGRPSGTAGPPDRLSLREQLGYAQQMNALRMSGRCQSIFPPPRHAGYNPGMRIRTNRPLAIWASVGAVLCAVMASAGGWPYGWWLCATSAINNAILAISLWWHADEPPFWQKRPASTDKHPQ